MSVREFEKKVPSIAQGVYVDQDAVVIGDVILSTKSSVWPLVVIRGDVNSISIGEQTNVQDGTIIHVTHDGPFSPGGHPTRIGNNVTIGHQAIIHACTIEGNALIGMGARILDAVVIEENVVLAAGSLVSPGKVLASGYLYMGVPARRVRALRQEEMDHIQYSAKYYYQLALRYQNK